jgi:hypothetical protein
LFLSSLLFLDLLFGDFPFPNGFFGAVLNVRESYGTDILPSIPARNYYNTFGLRVSQYIAQPSSSPLFTVVIMT